MIRPPKTERYRGIFEIPHCLGGGTPPPAGTSHWPHQNGSRRHIIITKLKELATASHRDKPPRRGTALPIVGILAIAAVEGYALNQGINGTALTAALTAIAALGGAGIGRLLK